MNEKNRLKRAQTVSRNRKIVRPTILWIFRPKRNMLTAFFGNMRRLIFSVMRFYTGLTGQMKDTFPDKSVMLNGGGNMLTDFKSTDLSWAQ